MIRFAPPKGPSGICMQCLPLSVRKASTLSAIKNGLRRTQSSQDKPSKQGKVLQPWQETIADRNPNLQAPPWQQKARREARQHADRPQRTVTRDELERTTEDLVEGADQRHSDLGFRSDKRIRRAVSDRERKETRTAKSHTQQIPRMNEPEDDTYVSVPYTQANSEFLYGANSVLAALKAGRRSLHKLYIDSNSQTMETRLRRDQIYQLATQACIPVDTRDQPGKRQVLDKMSQGRPHNGVVLEASPLPFAPVDHIVYNNAAQKVDLIPSQQGTITKPPFSQIHAGRHDGWRPPFILLLDGVLDPGNMGNIIRTAHFYSLTAVAICSNTCAPVSSSVTVKSSSGAIEAIPLINVAFPSNFIRHARENGWNVFAAVAPPDPDSSKQDSRQMNRDPVYLTSEAHGFLAQKPAILMLGAEGEGLRSIMVNKATHKISIPGGGRKDIDVGVDSLNVASAAAVLIDAMLKRPVPRQAEWTSGIKRVVVDRNEKES